MAWQRFRKTGAVGNARRPQHPGRTIAMWPNVAGTWDHPTPAAARAAAQLLGRLLGAAGLGRATSCGSLSPSVAICGFVDNKASHAFFVSWLLSGA